MSVTDKDMSIEYDEELQSYYIVWNPVTAVGLGGTEEEALEDLRQAAHFGIDSLVNLKLFEINHEEEVKRGKQG